MMPDITTRARSGGVAFCCAAVLTCIVGSHWIVAAGEPLQAPPRATPASVATQGRYALELARALGLGDADLTEDRAMGLLSAAQLAPESGWQKDQPATEAFIMAIQKQLHVMLSELTQTLKIPTPPTLNVMMFTGQAAGQTFGVLPQDLDVLQPARSAAQEDEKLKVGATAKVNIESPHPYPVGDERISPVWTYRVSRPGASFIKLHFTRLELAAPDYLVIRDKYGREVWRIIGGDKRTTDVWAPSVDGDTAIIALHADTANSAHGFTIDRYGYGTVSTP
jgi:hypothetical protein